MGRSWRRPSSVPLGTEWRRFRGRRRADGTTTQYVIRDVLPEDTERCLDFMTEAFLRDEPLCHALGIPADAVSVATIQQNWREYLAYETALACYSLDASGQLADLVAVNICLVKSADDPDEDIEQAVGDSWRLLLRTLTAAEATCDVFERYGVSRYLTSSGLTVAPAHRGQNIGAELFRAREPLCLALGLRATATVFTARTSQALAAKCGYEVLGELRYSDMRPLGVDLSSVVAAGTPSALHMGTRFSAPEPSASIN